jgi:hypothetical protein
MRLHFELKYGADNITEARAMIYGEIAKFMELDEASVPALVEVEFRVHTPDPESDSHLRGRFSVTAYANVKNIIAKPF